MGLKVCIAQGMEVQVGNWCYKPKQKSKEQQEDRNILYFGARHQHWKHDPDLTRAAIEGGAIGASTDFGMEQ